MKTSAGILLYKKQDTELYFFLVHPGGPFWKNKDIGAWSIPKGEIEENENALERARTEFQEETGNTIHGEFLPLTPIRQKSGKWVKAWAVEGDLNPQNCSSNSFTMQWPPRSGKQIQVPEVDRWEWFTWTEAQQKINPAQIPFILELFELLKSKL